MDYKKIFRTRNIRAKVLRMLSFVPDKPMIKLQYRMKTGRKLDLKNPKRYTEKLQWYKLYYREALLKQCVNKYLVREFIRDCGQEQILNVLYGVYDDPHDIDFSSLPNEFVIKDTVAGGSTSVIVVKDKANLDLNSTIETMQKWLIKPKTNHTGGREWPYYNQRHQIIIEKYLEQEDGDLADYKFFCFQGKVEYVYVRSDYAKNHDDAKMAFFDRNLNYINGLGMDYCGIAEEEPNIDKNVLMLMKDVAEKLAEKFPHVRVDLYYVKGNIVFGELTFFNASGYMKFEPDSFDFEIGNCFELPAHTRTTK